MKKEVEYSGLDPFAASTRGLQNKRVNLIFLLGDKLPTDIEIPAWQVDQLIDDAEKRGLRIPYLAMNQIDNAELKTLVTEFRALKLESVDLTIRDLEQEKKCNEISTKKFNYGK